jgi:cytochrome c-type protein NapB
MKRPGIIALMAAAVVAACASVGPLSENQMGLQKGSVFDTSTPAPFSFETAGPLIEPPRGSGMPPMISHAVDDDDRVITSASNACLQCHDRNSARKTNKPPKFAPASHYATADGKPAIAAGIYVCTGCHAPQADLAPLIENRSL